jgi:L-fucose mutarotase
VLSPFTTATFPYELTLISLRTEGPPPTNKKVSLNFAPGMLRVTYILTVLKDFIPFEAAIVMEPLDESQQTIHSKFEEILGTDVSLKKLKRFEFYEEVKSNDICIEIATGESRRFINILLIIGVVNNKKSIR